MNELGDAQKAVEAVFDELVTLSASPLPAVWQKLWKKLSPFTNWDSKET
jgi:hypothetical protein